MTKIDRKITSEPTYTSSPKYCLLVFGPEAKSRFWIVQDGDAVYIDRNGNGDLTEAGEKVVREQGDKSGDDTRVRAFDLGELKDGALTHTGLKIMQMKMEADSIGNDREFQRIKSQSGGPWTYWVWVEAARATNPADQLPKTVKYVANGDGLGYLLFGDTAKDAPIIHFNGPWTLGLQDIKQHVEIGKDTMVQIGVGTPGVGAGTFAFVLYPDLIPNDAYPVAELTLPANGSPPPEPIKVIMKKRC